MGILVIDANITRRVVTELRNRGLDSIAVTELGIRTWKDEPLLEAIAAAYPTGFTLVTADDHMPDEHAETVERLRATIAIVDPLRPPGVDRLEYWRRDVVHRWAHVMRDQTPGTLVRYGLRKTPWRKPRTIKPPSRRPLGKGPTDPLPAAAPAAPMQLTLPQSIE